MARKKLTKAEAKAEQIAYERELDVDHETVPAPPPKNPKIKAFEKLASGLKHWRPARLEFRPVRAVPTIFPALDRATRVGGYPLDRFGLVHGPSAMGKSELAIGLGLSFLQAGHVFAYVDAEFSTPPDWLEKLMGQHADNAGFLGKRPRSYEETVDAVRELVHQVASFRDRKEIPPETSALIVVDSIAKLVPEDFMAKIAKHGAQGEKGSVDGMGGMGGAILAKMNSDWLKELTPLLYHTGTTMLAIAREHENRDPYGPGYKVGGGKALIFDSSMSIRVTRDWVRQGSGKDAVVVGERHEIEINKSKVAGRDDRASYGYFHTSNGAIVPEGFDRARDVVELAREFGMVEGDSWLSWKGKGKRWQGVHNAVAKLHEDPEMLAELEAQVRAGFATEKATP